MTTPNLLAATSLQQGLLNTPALLPSGETTIYTVATSKAVKISTASLCNTTATAVTVSVSIVPNGGAAGTSNRIVASYLLAAYDTLSQEDGLAALKGAMLGENQFVSVNVGTASAVVFTATGTVVA